MDIWLTITWVIIIGTWAMVFWTSRISRRTSKRQWETIKIMDDMLTRNAVTMMVLDQSPVTPSTTTPGRWSIDVEPEVLAHIQSVAGFVRRNGGELIDTRKQGEPDAEPT